MKDGDGGPGKGRNRAEWTALAVSIVVVAAFVGAVLFEQFANDEPPAAVLAVELLLDRVEQRGERFYVPFEVTNTGGAPAEDVTLHFEVHQGGQLIEESTAIVPFLPSDGVEEGEVVLTTDPAQAEVTARIGNFLAP